MPRVRIGPPTLILLLFIALTDRSLFIIAPIVAALLHEAGHLLAMLALDVKVKTVEITLFGAEIRSLDGVCGARAAGQAAIYAAGPLMNLATGAAAVYFGFEFFAACSIALAVLNLLPIRTLDGGNLLAVLLMRLSADYERILNAVSAAFIFILWLAAVYIILLCRGNLSLLLFCVYMFFTLFVEKSV